VGEVNIRQEVVAYRRLEQVSERVLEVVPLSMPPEEYETVALWLALPSEMIAEYREQGFHLLGGLHGAEHALVAMLPLFAQCDVRDIGGVSSLRHPNLRGPALFLYDGYPGGVGLVEVGFERLSALLQATWEMVRRCPCEAGCPACIQSPFCGSGNEPLDKMATLQLFEQVFLPSA
jgi:DEAD/DEAH box helicase domain-containing protein